jgi:hypothetical protein
VGCQLVPIMKSIGDTEPNIGKPWLKRNAKIRITIITENKAQKKRAFSTSLSESFCLAFFSLVFSSVLPHLSVRWSLLSPIAKKVTGFIFPVLLWICSLHLRVFLVLAVLEYRPCIVPAVLMDPHWCRCRVCGLLDMLRF